MRKITCYFLFVFSFTAEFSNIPSEHNDAVSICDTTFTHTTAMTDGWLMTPDFGATTYENNLNCQVEIPHSGRAFLYVDVSADVSLVYL